MYERCKDARDNTSRQLQGQKTRACELSLDGKVLPDRDPENVK